MWQSREIANVLGENDAKIISYHHCYLKEDCQARKLDTEDAMDRSKWRKLIKDVQ